jgi:ankyrin repeat protein
MAMHRIEEQGPDQAELAREILSWVTYATRSLDAYQLREALAVRPGDYDFDEDNCPDIQDMVSSCAGLVTIDEGTHIVRLVHYTAQRYFDRMRHQLFPDADAMIAHTCITYLSFSMFRSSPSRIDGQRIQDRSGEWHWVKFEELPFQFNGRSPEALFSYAANCWGHHAHHAPSKDAQVVDFLRDPPNIQALGVAIDRDFSDLKSPPDPLKGGSTIGLHLAAYFGLEAVAAALLQHGSDPNTRTKLGYTPLMLAALNGHASIVSLLLNNRAMVGLTDQAYCTAVHHAAGSGRDSIIRLLLSKNTIGDSVQQLSAYQTQLLLHLATRGCHETTVELLLDSLGGVKGLSERSAPLHATRAGYVHTYAVQILRDANAETDLEARRDTSPLYNAVLRGNAAMVKLLLDHGAPVDVGGNKQGAYSTPLQQAAHKGDVEIVRLLLQAGAKPDPDVTFYNSPPALHASITHKEDAMVRLLVEAGADVNRNYASGHSPLYEAAKQDWEGGVKLLLSLGADINFQLKRGNNTLDLFLHEKPVADTAIMYAARSGDATAMKLLLHHGADAHLRNNRGESALDLAKDRLAKEMESSNAPREDTNVDTSMSRRRKIVPTECRECIRLLVERGAT